MGHYRKRRKTTVAVHIVTFWSLRNYRTTGSSGWLWLWLMAPAVGSGPGWNSNGIQLKFNWNLAETELKHDQSRFISFHFNQVQSVQLKNYWNDFSCFSFHFISIRFWKKLKMNWSIFKSFFISFHFNQGPPSGLLIYNVKQLPRALF